MKPLLLLHGALGSAHQLEPVRNSLAATGRQTFCVNFSGHGGRPFSPNGFGISVFAEDVLAFLEKNNLSHVDIFGYSMGGYVALRLANLYPEKVGRIVTLGTKFDWSPASAERERKKMNADKMMEKIPAFARLLQQRHAPVDWKELVLKTADMMMELGASPVLTESVIRTLPNPVVIALGDQDDMADRLYSEQVAEWLPLGYFKLLHNTPHPIEKLTTNSLLSLFEK